MAQIVINEISQNYTFNVGEASFATVALPITASWGPAYLDPTAVGTDTDGMMERTQWAHYPATQAGMEAFVAAYRGPASNFRAAKDYSYQQAMTLLSAGYDVLVCRVCPGAQASGSVKDSTNVGEININAKYAGSFGNNLRVKITKTTIGAPAPYWSLVTYVSDANGALTAVENIAFVFDLTNVNYTEGNVPHVSEIESQYITISALNMSDSFVFSGTDSSTATVTLTGGTDIYSGNAAIGFGTTLDDAKGNGGDVHTVSNKYYALVYTKPGDWSTSYSTYFKLTSSTAPSTGVTTWAAAAYSDADDWGTVPAYKEFTALTGVGGLYTVAATNLKTEGQRLAAVRYNSAGDASPTTAGFYTGIPRGGVAANPQYCTSWGTGIDEFTTLQTLTHMEWCYNAAFLVYQLLKDKLNYNPQRIISPGWDDMNLSGVTGAQTMFATLNQLNDVAPLHWILMDTAFYGRCATAYIDIPKALPRSLVYNDSTDTPGYAQILSRIPTNFLSVLTLTDGLNLYSTHSALFTCWTQYKMVGMSKMTTASPGFVALLIQRAEILNQASQYEWALPVDRKHNLSIGKMDYTVPEKLRQVWQKLEGVGVNILTYIPDYNINIWGNSTLFEVPPATYQALANLSTRFLVNAIEDVVYRVGLGITWQYNNQAAYSAFYAGVSPILDTMKQLGAIEGYTMHIAADIDGAASVNANSVVGVIEIAVVGVINNITVDLIALPQGTSLSSFGQ